MNYICGPIILYSFDKIRMLDFLSDVFEFEVDPVNDIVLFGGSSLKIKEIATKERSLSDHREQNQYIEFEFILGSQEELEEIVSKFNFFHYRKSDQAQNLVTEELLSEQNRLSICDIDGRSWTFNVKLEEETFGFLDDLLPLKEMELNDFS